MTILANATLDDLVVQEPGLAAIGVAALQANVTCLQQSLHLAFLEDREDPMFDMAAAHMRLAEAHTFWLRQLANPN